MNPATPEEKARLEKEKLEKAKRREKLISETKLYLPLKLHYITDLSELVGHTIKRVVQSEYEGDEDSIYHTLLLVTDKGIVRFDRDGSLGSNSELVYGSGVRIVGSDTGYSVGVGVYDLYWDGYPDGYQNAYGFNKQKLEELVDMGVVSPGILGYVEPYIKEHEAFQKDWAKKSLEKQISEAQVRLDELKKKESDVTA